MTRRPRQSWDDDTPLTPPLVVFEESEPLTPPLVVFEESEPERSGLLDADGRPLIRPREPIGYIRGKR